MGPPVQAGIKIPMIVGAWPSEDSASQNPGLWEGVQRLSTRRAGGVDLEGGRLRPFPVERMWNGGRGPTSHRLSMGNPTSPADRHSGRAFPAASCYF